jgi:hypothetical protein
MGSRSGRQLTISAKGLDTKSKAKEPQQKHMDDKKTEEALNEAGKLSGHTVRVDPGLNVKRAYWGMNDESFVHFGERVAGAGGVFKIKGSRPSSQTRRGQHLRAAMAIVTAMWAATSSPDMTPRMGRWNTRPWVPAGTTSRRRNGTARRRASKTRAMPRRNTTTAFRADKDEAKGRPRTTRRIARRRRAADRVDQWNSVRHPRRNLHHRGARPASMVPGALKR